MHTDTLIVYALVAWLNILTPGPAVMLAVRNGLAARGAGIALYSSLGNVCGLFAVSASSMLGLGVVLKSSAWLFMLFKILGALYLFYLGARHILGRASISPSTRQVAIGAIPKKPIAIYNEGLLVALTNPKSILFFTALFPQFIALREPLLPQFFILTAIFMTLSFATLIGYASAAGRVRVFLAESRYVSWTNRCVGCVFMAYGAALLALRRPLPSS